MAIHIIADDEEKSSARVQPETPQDPRVSPSDEYARRTPHARSPPPQGSLATHPHLTDRRFGAQAPRTLARLKRTQRFTEIYRRGRWVHGPLLSVGVLGNRLPRCQVGLRTRRGMKGAVVRNRLKRQLRAILTAQPPPRGGWDLVIVAHPKQVPVSSHRLQLELTALFRKIGVL